MENCTRTGYVAHSMLPAYKRRINQARAYIDEALALSNTPYVAWSVGGKDSSVMLHLILEAREDIEARVLVSGETRYLFPEFDGLVSWWRDAYPQMIISLVEIDRVWTSDMRFYEQRKAGRNDILTLLPTPAHDLVFMGLRDEESNIRKRANARGVIRQYARSRRANLRGTYVCVPISKLRTRDVAAYIITHNIPVFDVYTARGFEERTTLRLTGDAVRQMAFQRLRIMRPDKYNELLMRFPELKWRNG